MATETKAGEIEMVTEPFLVSRDMDDAESIEIPCDLNPPLSVSITGRRPNAPKLEPLVADNDDSLDVSEVPSTSSTSTNRIIKPLNLKFNDIKYTASSISTILKREHKEILKGVSGDFRAGELTAIMGPSGCGKSTLLNILSGYTFVNVNGSVMVNGRERDLRRFRHQAAYIMQDHEIQPYITVLEAMHFSVHLKIGNEMTSTEKRKRIEHILDAIGLHECRKIRAGKLSGGQKKRLAIALELCNNPPVMFFDEPTSGLDNSTSTQCVSLLKKLAQEGRTIIISIHQPSAMLFGVFDHLYVIAEGQCIYTGGSQYVVPFLTELDLKCPESYNPADYLLEISTNDYGIQNPRLVEKTINGKSEEYRKTRNDCVAQKQTMKRVDELMASGLMTPVKAPRFVQTKFEPLPTPAIETTVNLKNEPLSSSNTLSKRSPLSSLSVKRLCQRTETYATSFCRQLQLLLKRTFIILWRNKSLTMMRLIIHLFIALLIGSLYVGIGGDGGQMLNIFRYIFFSIMFLMYTAFTTMTLNFPLELPIVAREHFNQWYSLRAYYIAMTLADIPIQIGCTCIYVGITYFMTAQPLEFIRLAQFFFIVLMVSFVAQSIGLVVGAIFNVKNGSIFGPFFICPFLIFSGFFVRYSDAHPFMHWLFNISFLKYGLDGATIAILGNDRPKLDCHEMYCHYVRPQKFLKESDMLNTSYLMATTALVVINFIFRILAFYIMSYRLRNKR